MATFNATLIALILKNDDPESFEEYRLISLCNCIYKIITKEISRRVKTLLSRCIYQERFAFLVGRKIHEAVGTVKEVFTL